MYVFNRYDVSHPPALLQVSTLQILSAEEQVSVLSDDQVFSSRQAAKHTCMALRR